jgi:hypothetical protein
MGLRITEEGMCNATTADLFKWQELLLMCQQEGAARMGAQWIANAKAGLPLIAAELKRREPVT